MNEQQYKNGRLRLAQEFEDAKRKLDKEYAFANNPYKVGDTVTDHIGSLKIERIDFATGHNNLPCCVYFGIDLTKSGAIKKRQEGRGVYQCNLVSSKK